MKIKVLPQDFIVEEIYQIDPKNRGDYTVYKLEKESWDTFDLLDYLSRKHKLKNIGRAGIKDRYSHSIQYVTIKKGKAEDIIEKNFKLAYLGKVDQPITQHSQQGNLFRIVIRDLNQKETAYIMTNLASVRKFGLINYYDEQRMGSARAGQGFIAEKLAKEHYNGALKLYLATPSKFDDSKTRQLKKHIFEHWQNWPACLNTDAQLGNLKHPLNHLLLHPKDFKGAIKTIRKELLEMFINAYQAYVWNETVKALLQTKKIDYIISRYAFGELYFYQQLNKTEYDYLNAFELCAPSYKSHFSEDGVKPIMEQVLSQDKMQLKDLKIYLNIKGLFFKPYLRKVVMQVHNLQASEPMIDELYPKKYKISLCFSLTRGSYATILIKRITNFSA